jgi:ABC-type Fe2+-enterobactin transport system substrate-binding protein
MTDTTPDTLNDLLTQLGDWTQRERLALVALRAFAAESDALRAQVATLRQAVKVARMEALEEAAQIAERVSDAQWRQIKENNPNRRGEIVDEVADAIRRSATNHPN